MLGLLSALVAFEASAQSSGTPSSCSLPVCDIPAEVNALKGSSQNTRYQFLVNIHNQYKKTLDPLVLADLRDFSVAVEAMLRGAQEEDWVIREAQSLLSDRILGLARYARPVSADQLTAWYGQLATEDPRLRSISS